MRHVSHSKPVVLTRPDQLRAATSLIAHQIISVMERTRRCTVAELAEHTGVEAGSLYYHVRKLKKIGVLLEHDRRSTGGRQEVVYELAGSEVVFDPDGSSPGFLKELARTVRSRLRMVERAFIDALGRPGTVRKGRGKNLSLHQHHFRLSARNRAELFRRIEDLEEFMFEHDDPARTDFTHVSIAILPVARTAEG
jgi:AcrR family transcriptional regulator